MKKKLVILLTAICAVSMLGACGTKKKEAKEYDASDYVKLGEYKGIKVDLESNYEVTDEDVKKNVESLLTSYPSYEDLDKTTVENGDHVNIDFEGLKDGEAFDGGSAKGTVLEIGSNSFIEGFESGLIGANVGDKVSLNLTFPKEYQNADMAGQDVVFNVTINKIVTPKELTYDTLTDEYVVDNFSGRGYENVEDLKNGVKDQLAQSNESTKESDTQNAILEKLKEECKVDSLPEGIVDKRVKEYKKQMETALKESYNMEMKDYLESINTTEKDFNKQTVEYIEKNLELEMILTAIADKENIKADEEGYKEYVANIVSSSGYKDEKALMDEYGEDYVKTIYRNNKALELVRENAVVTYGKSTAK